MSITFIVWLVVAILYFVFMPKFERFKSWENEGVALAVSALWFIALLLALLQMGIVIRAQHVKRKRERNASSRRP